MPSDTPSRTRRSSSRFAPTRLVLASLALVARVAAAQGKPPAVPADVFPAPTGSFAIGTIDTLFIDAARDERLTKDGSDKRHVPIQIWYPAEASGGAPAKYVQRPAEFEPQSPFGPALHVVTHAVSHAPVATRGGKFPVLLYNHGGGWTRFTATYEIEQLVSLGYVVVSVDHLGFDQSKSLANGYTFKGDTLGFPTPTNTDPKADARASLDYLEAVLFPIWVADAQFALDRIALLNTEAVSPLRGRLDLSRIGAFGWSFGGATAIDLSIRDPRIKAAIDQDGQLFGFGRTRGSARPVMLMHNGSDLEKEVAPNLREMVRDLMKTVSDQDEAFRKASTSDVYDVKIARTGHGHFSDLTYFIPPDSTQLTARRAHDVITAYTVAFFERYLRGVKSPLLDAPSAAYPEATFRRVK